MTLLARVRRVARRAGLETYRYPAQSPEYRVFRAMMSTDPGIVIDVGANDGGFARGLRGFGYRGRVVSFEPGRAAFAALCEGSRNDGGWTCHQLCVGAEDTTSVIHIADNSGASSSLLSMLPNHALAAPDSAYTHDEPIQVRRLDTLAADLGRDWGRPALKVDTQGYEQRVLEGCGLWLDEVVALRIELSIVPLYEGGWLWQEATDWLYERGFALAGLEPGFSDPRTGRLLQFDGLFVRHPRSEQTDSGEPDHSGARRIDHA